MGSHRCELISERVGVVTYFMSFKGTAYARNAMYEVIMELGYDGHRFGMIYDGRKQDRCDKMTQ